MNESAGMFVFPAFDKNYDTRKRTFKCCNHCRTRKTKCDVSVDYDTRGCYNCIRNKLICDLITKDFEDKDSEPAIKRLRSGRTIQNPTKKKKQTKEPKPSSRNTNKSKSKSKSNITTNLRSNFTTISNTGAIDPLMQVIDNSELDPPVSSGPSKISDQIDLTKSPNPTAPNSNKPEALNQLDPPVNDKFNSMADKIVGYNYVDTTTNNQSEKPTSTTDSQLRIPEVISPPTTTHSSNGFSHSLMLPINSALVTETFLKQQFNFNMCGPFLSSKYAWLVEPKPKLETAPEILSPVSYQFLRAINAFTIASDDFPIDQTEIKDLIQVYLIKYNRIFPLIQEFKLWEDYNAGNLPTILVLAILNISLCDKLSRPIVARIIQKLGERTNNPYRISDLITEKANKIHAKIQQLLIHLPNLDDQNKLIRLIVHALLSMKFFFKYKNIEQYHGYLAYAVHSCISLNFHKALDDTEWDSYKRGIWWTCQFWCRLNHLVNLNDIDSVVKLDYNASDSVNPMGNIHLYKLLEHVKTLNRCKESGSDLQKMIDQEFELCDSEIINVGGFKGLNESKTIELNIMDFESPDYNYNYKLVALLCRLVTNGFIIKTSNNVNDKLKAANNILFLVYRVDPKELIDVPIVPWSIQLSFLQMFASSITTKQLPPNFEEYLHLGHRLYTQWINVEYLYHFAAKLKSLYSINNTNFHVNLLEFGKDIEDFDKRFQT